MPRKLIVLLFILAAGLCVKAQKPYTWSFSARKVADRTYEIHCVADVDAPWHTYSQFTPDGGPLATKFSFVSNPLYSLEGKVKENGKLIVKHEAVFDVDVKYFEGRVDFVQTVKLKKAVKTNLSGSVEFMVCNDQQCLPPATEKFSLPLN